MSRNKSKILIIDDDPVIVQTWTMVLEDEGFNVHAAFSGKEGIRATFLERPDLIVPDIKMPGMDGFEVLDHLRLMTDIPIIMLTAIGSDPNRIRALDKGITDFVPKISHSQLLISSIHNRLHSYRGVRPTQGPLKVDEHLTIDFPLRMLYYDNVKVSLTPIQWKILQSLVEKTGNVASYRDLLRAGWENPDSQETHLVKVQISLLRGKLKDKARTPRYIHTAREDGYSFELR